MPFFAKISELNSCGVGTDSVRRTKFDCQPSMSQYTGMRSTRPVTWGRGSFSPWPAGVQRSSQPHITGKNLCNSIHILQSTYLLAFETILYIYHVSYVSIKQIN